MNTFMRIFITGVFLCLLSPAVSSAAVDETGDLQQSKPPSLLSLPIDCTLGENCWLVNYLDHNMGKGIQDLRCFMRSYDGHRGLDFALPDRITMFSSISVLAPADATVIDIRNTVADHDGTKPHLVAARKEGKECGNKVALHLGDNWFVEFCHLKQGSVSVKVGDEVKRGQKLAEVGLSGMSSFAHLHVGLKHGNTYIDPLTDQPIGADCTPPGKDLPGQSLWEPAAGVAYSPVDLYAAGFLNDKPEYKVLKESTFSASSMPVETQIFTYWVTIFGLAPGDELDLIIRDPGGEIYASNHQTHSRHSSQYMYFVGKKTAKEPLTPGIYTGEATLTRKMPDGSTLKRTITKQVTIR